MTWAAGTPGYTAFAFSSWVYVPTGHTANRSIMCGPSGTVQIQVGGQNQGVISARADGTNFATTSTNAYNEDTWFHLHIRMGVSLEASKHVIVYVDGSEVASTTAGSGLASTALNGTWYLMEDDGSDADFDGRLFDCGLFGADLAVSNRNQSGSSWADFGSTSGIVNRTDGQTSGDATRDSSGSSNHWTQTSGGGSVITSETSLPTGANP